MNAYRSHGFRDRMDAGDVLARHLLSYRGRPGLLVLGIPRGGVPVAARVAQALGAELDVLVVRKLGVPGQQELAMGAITSGGGEVLNRDVVRECGIDRATIDAVAARERGELRRRERAYRGDRPPLDVAGRTVIVVDDGLATGATMRAAVLALRARRPDSIVVAVPVAPPATCRGLQPLVERLVCVVRPRQFLAVGAWYEDFSATTDEEVRALLERPPAAGPTADIEVLSLPGHGRARWRECPACGSHELRPPTPEERAHEPSPHVVCFECGVAIRVRPDGTLAAVR